MSAPLAPDTAARSRDHDFRPLQAVIEGDCVVESGGDQLAEPDLPWSGRFHDPAPRANIEEGRAWLRLNDEPVREGAITITRAGAGPGAGLIDFDGIGSLR